MNAINYFSGPSVLDFMNISMTTPFPGGKLHNSPNKVAYRSLNDTDIDNLWLGKDITSSGSRSGKPAQADLLERNARDTVYISTTEIHPSKLKLADPSNYIEFYTPKTSYISKEEFLKNKYVTKKYWIEQQGHSLVKNKISIDSILKIVLYGEDVTEIIKDIAKQTRFKK